MTPNNAGAVPRGADEAPPIDPFVATRAFIQHSRAAFLVRQTLLGAIAAAGRQMLERRDAIDASRSDD